MPPGHPSTPIPVPAGSKLCSCCMGWAVGARPPPCPRLGTPQRLGTLPLSAPRGLGSPSPTHAANPPGGLYSRISTCRHGGYLPFSGRLFVCPSRFWYREQFSAHRDVSSGQLQKVAARCELCANFAKNTPGVRFCKEASADCKTEFSTAKTRPSNETL